MERGGGGGSTRRNNLASLQLVLNYIIAPRYASRSAVGLVSPLFSLSGWGKKGGIGIPTPTGLPITHCLYRRQNRKTLSPLAGTRELSKARDVSDVTCIIAMSRTYDEFRLFCVIRIKQGILYAGADVTYWHGKTFCTMWAIPIYFRNYLFIHTTSQGPPNITFACRSHNIFAFQGVF